MAKNYKKDEPTEQWRFPISVDAQYKTVVKAIVEDESTSINLYFNELLMNDLARRSQPLTTACVASNIDTAMLASFNNATISYTSAKDIVSENYSQLLGNLGLKE